MPQRFQSHRDKQCKVRGTLLFGRVLCLSVGSWWSPPRDDRWICDRARVSVQVITLSPRDQGTSITPTSGHLPLLLINQQCHLANIHKLKHNVHVSSYMFSKTSIIVNTNVNLVVVVVVLVVLKQTSTASSATALRVKLRGSLSYYVCFDTWTTTLSNRVCQISGYA